MKKMSCLIFIIVMLSCSNDDKELRNLFRYNNDTSHTVQLVVYGKSVSLIDNTDNDTTKISPNSITGGSYSFCVGEYCEGSNTEPFRGLSDSAKILFDDKRQLMFYPNVNCNTNVLCRKAYKQTVEYNDLMLTYTIDNSHFEQAVEIK